MDLPPTIVYRYIGCRQAVPVRYGWQSRRQTETAEIVSGKSQVEEPAITDGTIA